MKTKEFNKLQKDIKAGKIEGLKKEVIENLTLLQAQKLEDKMLDIELTEEGNKILDILTAYIVAGTKEEKKVANKKAPKAPAKEEKKEAPKKEAPEAPKKDTKEEETKSTSTKKKSSLKGNKPANKKASEAIKEGQIVKFRVEDEEVEHNIQIVKIGKYHIIAIMEDDEKEVFNIRKTDFDKLIFGWKDRHNEEYNIIVTL